MFTNLTKQTIWHNLVYLVLKSTVVVVVVVVVVVIVVVVAVVRGFNLQKYPIHPHL